MGRKAMILALCLALTLGTRVRAEEAGTVDVVVRNGDTPITGCRVELYRAGEEVEEGYRLEEKFGGGMILAEDIFSPDLASWMAQRAYDGMDTQTDAEGVASFRGLPEGLYLVTQETEVRFRPYLVCISEEIPYIDTYPEIRLRQLPRTGRNSAAEGAFLGLPLSAAGLGVLVFREILKKKRPESISEEK